MTTSPYDNLPSGNKDISQEPLEYVEVEIPNPKTPEHKPSEAHIPAAPKPAKTTPLVPPPVYDHMSISNYQGCYEYLLPFEESLLVPDTMPDMHKVLFAEGRADLADTSKLSYGRNDFFSGSIVAYTVYDPSEKPIDVIKSTIPFKTDKCWSVAEGDSFRATASISSIKAEMVNERKFVIKGELLIKMTGIASHQLKLFKSSAEKNLVFSSGSVNTTDLTFETTDTIDISQEITIKDGLPSPEKILKTDFRITENHRQITSGKLVINASIHSQILYKSCHGEEHDNGAGFFCITNKTDFTQFIAADNISDPALIKIDFNGRDLDISIENKDKFLLQGDIITSVYSYSSKTLPVVNDAYHKDKDLYFDKTTQDIMHIGSVVNGEISAREVTGSDDMDKKPAALLCGSCSIGDITSDNDNGRITINGSCPASILALDDDGRPFVIEHVLPIRGVLDLPNDQCSEPDICIDTSIKEFWFSEINSRQIELNVTISITIWAVTKETFCTIEDLRFAEPQGPAKRISMAIYVVSRGDTLWDVAKRYRVEPDDVAALNDLDPSKPLPEGAKLFLAK